MTWLNTLAKVLSLAIVLPLILRRFSPGDIALYYLFASIISLQLMAGAGFVPTFARFVSYILAGAKLNELVQRCDGSIGSVDGSPVDANLFSALIGTMRRVFLLLSITTVPIVVVIGTWLLLKPMESSSNHIYGWSAWAVIVATTPIVLYANQYSSLLQGANRVALDQRWSALFILAGALSGLIALLCGGGLFTLIAVNQVWQLVSFVRLAWLGRMVLRELPFQQTKLAFSKEIFQVIWPSSWRSFVGVASSNGIMALSALIFAQRLAADSLAAFLFGLRIMSMISEICRAPFYSKLPLFNRMRACGDLAGLASAAQHGMRISYSAFLILFVLAPLSAVWILPLIRSNTQFPDTWFWLILGVSVFVERFGAMHVQLYSTTNHIIWHWLNGVTGIIWIALMLLLIPVIGLYAYPISMLIGYLGCYSVVGVRRSLVSVKMTFWQFERSSALPAFFVLLVIVGVFTAWEVCGEGL